jgi:uncharacterized protein (DUF433 family)
MPIARDISICEIPPQGLTPSKRVGVITGPSYQEEELTGHAVAYPTYGGPAAVYWPHFTPNYLAWHKLHWLDARQRQLNLWHTSTEEEVRAYSIPLIEVFHRAARSCPQVSINPDVMAGAPCVHGTRIPVYMILDAIEYQGSVEGALESYPRLTLAQVKEAIGFAKLVVECPIEHEDTLTA